ncbi:hypothetical protein EW145_g7951 [Phellinidium pouzarii]|uniref:Yeast cell wall synthesis Kre9/Knh1-like N-terminal domain-containing protein n=1 Tax=Phellinidium pouzarii TaxID=167371 RepID=A0A4S4KBU8_9AGAM|nr:hypothetical protein EW145_g7951 [Phellinidium pouzarii]
MFARAAILVSLAASSMATVFLTNPTSSTTCNGGQPCTIAWKDDNTAPLLADFGLAMVSIYVGNVNQQTQLQEITQSVNVVTTSTIQFTPDASIGPDGDMYFIRFEATNSTSTTPNEAFSAKFTLNNMSGTFNSTVQAQIDAASSAGSPGPSSPASSGPAGTSSSTGSSSSSTGTSGSSQSSSSASSTSSASTSASSSAGERNVVTVGAFGVVGVVAAFFSFAL